MDEKMSKFITVAVFQYPHEAYIIKGRLESEGIEVFLQDELTVQAYNFISNAVGGVKLQIKESDFDKAIPILKSAGILDSQKKETETRNKAMELLVKIPLFKRQAPEIKIVLYSAIFLVFIAVLIYLIQIPTKEERLVAKEKKEQLIKEKRLELYYLPKVDSLVEFNAKEAVRYITKLNGLYPENADLFFSLGIAYYKIDSLRLAIKCFEKSMDSDGQEYPLVLSNIAICKIELGDFDGAIDNLISASEINYDYWVDLGYAYEAKGDLENAVKYFSKYIDRKKKFNEYFEQDRDFKFLEERTDSIRRSINYEIDEKTGKKY